MQPGLLILAMIAATGPALAQSVTAPRLREGDTWQYQNTTENRSGWHQSRDDLTIVRAGSSTIAYSVKAAGSEMPAREQLGGADWSRFRSVNGHETVVNRPLAFPLSVGKSWDLDYTEDHPNREHSSEHFQRTYRVADWEDVTVPGGTFHALRIEADGKWSAAIAPGLAAGSGARVDAAGSTVVQQTVRIAPRTVEGRTFGAYWYVPAVGRFVKSVEEYYDPNGTRTERYTGELVSFHVAAGSGS